MPKDRALRSIDLPPKVDVGTLPESATVAVDYTPPALPRPLAPTNLALSTATEFATASPSARVTATWDPPPGVQPRSYVAQISEDSSFPAAGTLTLYTRADVESVDFGGRRPGVMQYVRVAAVTQTQGPYTSMSPLTTGVNRIVAALDTTPAGQVSSLAGTWVGLGDLLLTWDNPSIVTYPNFRDVEIKIFASNGGAQLGPAFYSSTGRFLFTAAMNLQYTSGAGDPSLYVEVRSRTWSNVVNNSSVPTLTTTKSAPTAPSVAHSWSGETDHAGVAGADLTFTFTLASDVAKVRLSLNGQTAREVYGTVYTYPYARNVADNSSPGDPTLSYSAIAVDGLGQLSSATTGNATNEDPAAPASVAINGFYSAFSIGITATPPADFSHYLVRIIQTSPVSADVTFKTTNTLITRTINAAATYQVGVKVVDVFGQESNETLSSTTTLDALLLADLRSRIVYSDSEATAAATLKAALADDIKTSGGISYASNAGWVRSIRSDWQLLERIRTITLSMTPASGTTNWYVRLSKDGSTWSYFAGPVVATGTTGLNTTLTSVADAAAAQAAPVSAATLGGQTTSRIDLPTLQEARYVEVWLRNTGANTRVDEFFPRRLVQGDDGEFESIKGINIAAASVTADRLSVLQLSAITADMGSLTAGTITGAVIRTAASGARVELNSGAQGGLIGYGSGDTYNPATGSGTYQILWRKSDGKFLFANSKGILDGNGISLLAGVSAYDSQVAYKLMAANNVDLIGALYSLSTAAGANVDQAVYVDSTAPSNGKRSVNLQARTSAGYDASALLYADGNATVAYVEVKANSTGSLSQITLNATDTYVTGGLNLGSATGAGAGAIKGSSSLQMTSGLFTGGLTVGGSSFLSSAGELNTTSHAFIAGGLNVGAASGAAAGVVLAALADAGTTNVADLAGFEHRSSGTPAAGFGLNIRSNLKTSTTNNRPASVLQTIWATATEGSQKARLGIFAYDTAAREGVRIEASGTAAMLGLLGAAAVTRPNITGVRTGTLAQLQTVVANILTSGANLGAWTDSTT